MGLIGCRDLRYLFGLAKPLVFILGDLPGLDDALLIDELGLLVEELVLRRNNLPLLVDLNSYFDLLGHALQVLVPDNGLHFVLEVQVRHLKHSHVPLECLENAFELVHQLHVSHQSVLVRFDLLVGLVQVVAARQVAEE